MIRLALRCRPADAEAVLADLLEVAPGGIEQVDPPAEGGGLVEYAIYGAQGELPDLGRLQAAVGGLLVEVRSEPVPSDWSERWKRFYHPVLIGGRLYVRPPWERPAERAGVVEVVIDPGRAFGTGTHPTTRMCLELLLDEAAVDRRQVERARRVMRRALGHPVRRRSVCDVGSGSGVLAIAAAKLGFQPVVAVDSEPAALEETGRNARANYVEVEERRLDVREAPLPRADVVAANLTGPLVETVARAWANGDGRPGVAIVSGFLAREGEAVSRALAGAGLHPERRLLGGEWVALLARER